MASRTPAVILTAVILTAVVLTGQIVVSRGEHKGHETLNELLRVPSPSELLLRPSHDDCALDRRRGLAHGIGDVIRDDVGAGCRDVDGPISHHSVVERAFAWICRDHARIDERTVSVDEHRVRSNERQAWRQTDVNRREHPGTQKRRSCQLYAVNHDRTVEREEVVQNDVWCHSRIEERMIEIELCLG